MNEEKTSISEQHISAKDLQNVQNLTLMDDTFLTACFRDYKEGAELFLKIVLGRQLTVTSVKTQELLRNLYGRSIQVDAHITDSIETEYNIEIQRASEGAPPERARYHGSILDANVVNPGTDFKNLPETYIIFLTDKDIFHAGEPIYEVERIVKQTGKPFNDRLHIVYVNGEYNSDDSIGRLVHDFKCANPDDMYYKEFAEKTRYFKSSKEGVLEMSSFMDEYQQRGEYRRAVASAERLLKNGKLTHEEIADAVQLTLAEIKKIAGQTSA